MSDNMDWDEYLRESLDADDLGEVREALAHGANPNLDQNGDGHTALYWAAMKGNVDLIHALLKAGATVAAEKNSESTSLHAAVEDKNLPVVEMLLRADGAVALNWFDFLDYTPLMCAVRENNVTITRCLIEAGADVNAHNEARAGDTALHIAERNCALDIVQLLLKAGADPTIQGFMWITPLGQARKRKKAEGRQMCEMLEAAALKRGRNQV